MALLVGPRFALAADVTPLGDLSGGIFNSVATSVSADGLVVVGQGFSASGTEAFRWTAGGGIIGLGDLPGDPGFGLSFFSRALAVNADGSVVVGSSIGFNGQEAFRWTPSGGMVGLGDIPGGNFFSEAFGVNADGSVVVGQSAGLNGSEAFRWTPGIGMVGLGGLPGAPNTPGSAAYGVNSDGSVVVGRTGNAFGFLEAFRWTPGGGMVGLGDLPGGAFASWARAVNEDGSVIVGQGTSAAGPEAIRWTSGTGMVSIGDLPGGPVNSIALSVNADGSVIVGQGNSATGPEAFYWEQGDGLRSLANVLIGQGVNVAGITLSTASDVSADGLVVVGAGIFGSGLEAYIARLDAPSGGPPAGILTFSELSRSVSQMGAIIENAHAGIFSDLGMLVDVARTFRCDRQSDKPAGQVCGFAAGTLFSRDEDELDVRYGSGTVGLAWHAVPGLTVGAGALLSRTDGDLAHLGSSDARAAGGGVYASYIQPGGGFELMGAGIVRRLDFDIERGYLNGASPNYSTGETEGTAFSGLVRAGYALPVFAIATITPFAEYAVVRSKIDGYDETGGAFPASFDETSDTAQRLRLGGEVRGRISPTLEAWSWVAWNHRFDDAQVDVAGQLQGLFAFDIAGPSFDGGGGDAGVGLKWEAAPGLTTLATVGGSFGSETDPEVFGRIGASIQLGQIN